MVLLLYPQWPAKIFLVEERKRAAGMKEEGGICGGGEGTDHLGKYLRGACNLAKHDAHPASRPAITADVATYHSLYSNGVNRLPYTRIAHYRRYPALYRLPPRGKRILCYISMARGIIEP